MSTIFRFSAGGNIGGDGTGIFKVASCVLTSPTPSQKSAAALDIEKCSSDDPPS